ncbi:MAG: D-alanine--poly(phosphoribitol) ligase subunit DltC [Bacillaceae bacterium]
MRETVLAILEEICQTDEVRNDLDLQLFEEGLLDSLGTVTLLVELEEKLDVMVSISDFDREEWATPNLIIAKVEGLK